PAAFATSFCLTMMLYGNFFPGFPWVLPGYIWCCHEIFLQTLSLYGIYGLSFVTLLISGFLGLAFRCHKSHDFKKSKIAALISVLIFSLAVLFGWYRLANNPVKFTDKKVRTIQADISQKNKNDHKLSFSNLIEHIKLSLHDSPIDLIIWPEASVPYLYKEDFRQLHDHLKSFLHKGECLLAGVVRQGLSDGKIYNSVVAIDHDGKNIATFDKRRLLPFGEYVPFREYIPFESIAGDIGDFCVGEKTNISVINGIKIAFAICYEIVFPNNFVPGEADVIVNVTNDGWFGFTTEPFQHLQISRARAIENGVPLLRVTNYGISAIFDSFGREIARVPINQSGVTDTNIPRKADAIF
ncbi:MAG: apolipoprotein N-acyltransferase, partial [Holosporaceae bacterium]|nr:apolipoprotein N-acyltransferase [Holosporaceae bacterium]